MCIYGNLPISKPKYEENTTVITLFQVKLLRIKIVHKNYLYLLHTTNET